MHSAVHHLRTHLSSAFCARQHFPSHEAESVFKVRVENRYVLPPQRVQCCEVCGVIAHEGCVRKVPHDCRPAAEAGDRMLHLWKPAGIVLHDEVQHFLLSTSATLCNARDVFRGKKMQKANIRCALSAKIR